MDKVDKVDIFVLIIILVQIWLATTIATSIGSYRKDLKEQRADIEELYLRSEKLFERSNANNR